jgi:ATP-dependent Clp protease ATP-binding subunit ClpC
MFNFNLRKTAIFQGVVWERNIVSILFNILKKVFSVSLIIVFLLFLYGFIPQNFSEAFNRQLLGLSILFAALTVIFWIPVSFLNSSLKKPFLNVKLKKAALEPDKYNIAEFLSFDSAKSLFKSIKYARKKNIAQLDSSILLHFLLRDNPDFDFLFSRALLSSKEVKKILKEQLKTLTKIHLASNIDKKGKSSNENILDSAFEQIILDSLIMANNRGHERIEALDIIPVLAKHNPIFKKLLISVGLKPKDMENLSSWLYKLKKKDEELKKFWEWKSLLLHGSLAKEWAAGYTITLDDFSVDLSRIAKIRGFAEIVGHENEIDTAERILSREENNNVLIVGEPGSGRGGIIEALLKKSSLGEGLPNINYKRFVQLDLTALLSQSETIEAAADLLDRIFAEVTEAGNIVLVINEFHNFVGGIMRPGVIDISGMLSSYLYLPQFQVIAVTTFAGLHRQIEQNPSILGMFEKVEVSEISQEETLVIIENEALRLEFKNKKFVSYQALRDIVFYCDKYLADTPFPEKALDLLDEIMVYVVQKKKQVFLPEHVAKVVSDKTEIPVGDIEQKEKDKLLNLEELIHERIINQEEAVNEVSSALRRARAQIEIRKGPMGTFLFLGPTGVGKTETSKSLAEIYFGSEEKMIRLDMSEFQNPMDIPRLIGSPGEEGMLTTCVKESPFSLVLLDEIEKAHPNILNLFLQVLDEGYLTDGMGRKIDFRNTIIIATSNAGYLIIINAIKQGKEMHEIKEELLDFLFSEGIFRPEFINRFDALVLFKALTRENLLDIAGLLLDKMKKNLAQKEIEFVITKELKKKIVELSYNPKFGAREMRRVMQDKISNILAKALLGNKIQKEDRIEIDPKDFSLKINP